MRPPNKNRNNRNKSGRKPMGNVSSRVFESAGPEGKVRGTPQQIIEKYLNLARDAQTSGDRVMSENFLQHAEHYIRVLSASQAQTDERRNLGQGGGRPDGDDAARDDDDDFEGFVDRFSQPERAPQQAEPHNNGGANGGDPRDARQHDRPRRDHGHERPRRDGPDDRPRREDRPHRDRGEERGSVAEQPAPSSLDTIDPIGEIEPTLVSTPESRTPESRTPDTRPPETRAPETHAPESRVEEASPAKASEPRRRRRRAPAADEAAPAPNEAAPAQDVAPPDVAPAQAD